MTQTRYTASQLDIYIDGGPIDDGVMNSVVEVVVDQHTHLPNMFRIRVYDQTLALIDGNLFGFGKTVEIVGIDGTGKHLSLIKGEITAVEPTFGEGMIAELVVQGYDKSHRLYRETRTESYLNVKDSDLAERFAGKAGLSPIVDSTTIVYDHVFQNNQSDLAFLMQRAWRIGFECFVNDGKLYFRKPVNESGGGQKLTWGEDLISFRPRASLAEQVDEVSVHGWDARAQDSIVGRARRGGLYPESTEIGRSAKDHEAFGRGKKIIVNQPVVSQAEADRLAQARLDELSGSYLEAEGEAFRRPDVRAGQMVELADLGEKYSGSYMVTSATHVFSGAGLRVFFKVNGSRLGTLAEQMTHREPLDRWPGVVVGKVTNTNDPNNHGRIKVTFPWMSDDAESDWARLVGPGAGPNAGFIAVPAVGDEVLVAFELGDFSRPIIIGGLWSRQIENPEETAGAKTRQKPLVRSWRSRKGHWISMHDDSDQKVHMQTTDSRKIEMNDTDEYIEMAGPANLLGRNRYVKIDDKLSKLIVQGSTGHNIVFDDLLHTVAISSISTLMGIILDEQLQTIAIGWGVPKVGRNHGISISPAGVVIESDTEVVVKSSKDLILQAEGDVSIRGKNIKLEKYNASHSLAGKVGSELGDAAGLKQHTRAIGENLAAGSQPLNHLNPNQN